MRHMSLLRLCIDSAKRCRCGEALAAAVAGGAWSVVAAAVLDPEQAVLKFLSAYRRGPS